MVCLLWTVDTVLMSEYIILSLSVFICIILPLNSYVRVRRPISSFFTLFYQCRWVPNTQLLGSES